MKNLFHARNVTFLNGRLRAVLRSTATITSSSSRRQQQQQQQQDDHYDYVVVGAGSAGCVVASRLVLGDVTARVLLIEAGPPNDRQLKVRIPAAVIQSMNDLRQATLFKTVPQKYVNNRVLNIHQGKMIGGSSSVNFMVYVRGHPEDYNRWAFKEGATGWSYADCLPYFIKMESHELGVNDYHGDNGMLHVSRGTSRNPLTDAFIKAGQEAGYPATQDFNAGYKQEGFGRFDFTIKNGERASASAMYLRPVMKTDAGKRLTVLSDTMVSRILFEGKKAVGVQHVTAGVQRTVRVKREAILCGGAFNSPQLLMLSGVGPADELKRNDIKLVHHSPGVGSNLQMHNATIVQQRCKLPVTLNLSKWRALVTGVTAGLQWLLTSSGFAATHHLEGGAFLRSRNDVTHPDIEYQLAPGIVDIFTKEAAPFHGFQVMVVALRPSSRGTVRLASADPAQPPLIDPACMASQGDWTCLRSGIRIAREILKQQAFDPYRDEELLPGPKCQSDAELDACIRETVQTIHMCGTCKMGSPEKDETVVVDTNCRVVGVDGLRVIDASVMPSVVSGNTNAAVIMIAEKASDMILGESKTPQ